MKTITFTCETITPMFLSGADAQAIAATLRAFAGQVETALSQAKAEAKGYTFGLERTAQKDA